MAGQELNMAGLVWKMYQPFVETLELVETTLIMPFHIIKPKLDVVPIPSQLSAFSELKFQNGKPMVGTFRPVQPLNGRQVYRSGCSMTVASATFLAVALATALGLSQPN